MNEWFVFGYFAVIAYLGFGFLACLFADACDDTLFSIDRRGYPRVGLWFLLAWVVTVPRAIWRVTRGRNRLVRWL